VILMLRRNYTTPVDSKKRVKKNLTDPKKISGPARSGNLQGHLLD